VKKERPAVTFKVLFHVRENFLQQLELLQARPLNSFHFFIETISYNQLANKEIFYLLSPTITTHTAAPVITFFMADEVVGPSGETKRALSVS
jgi:hypothetical protein